MKELKTYSFFTGIETDPEPVLCKGWLVVFIVQTLATKLFLYSSKTGGLTVPVVDGHAL